MESVTGMDKFIPGRECRGNRVASDLLSLGEERVKARAVGGSAAAGRTKGTNGGPCTGRPALARQGNGGRVVRVRKEGSVT